MALRKEGIFSIRDLDASHLPFLEEMKQIGQQQLNTLCALGDEKEDVTDQIVSSSSSSGPFVESSSDDQGKEEEGEKRKKQTKCVGFIKIFGDERGLITEFLAEENAFHCDRMMQFLSLDELIASIRRDDQHYKRCLLSVLVPEDHPLSAIADQTAFPEA